MRDEVPKRQSVRKWPESAAWCSQRRYGTSLTFTAEENTIKKTLRNRISIRFHFGHFFFKLLTLPLMTPWKYFCTTGVNVLEKVLLCTGETLAAYNLQKLSITVKLYVHSRRDTLYQSHFNSISDTVQKEYQLDDWHHQLVFWQLDQKLLKPHHQ